MEVSRQLRVPVALSPGEKPSEPIGGWVGLRAGLEAMEKRKILPLPGTEPPAIQPVARHYIDWAIPALYMEY
jgi:hypothetical protein